MAEMRADATTAISCQLVPALQAGRDFRLRLAWVDDPLMGRRGSAAVGPRQGLPSNAGSVEDWVITRGIAGQRDDEVVQWFRMAPPPHRQHRSQEPGLACTQGLARLGAGTAELVGGHPTESIVGIDSGDTQPQQVIAGAQPDRR